MPKLVLRNQTPVHWPPQRQAVSCEECCFSSILVDLLQVDLLQLVNRNWVVAIQQRQKHIVQETVRIKSVF